MQQNSAQHSVLTELGAECSMRCCRRAAECERSSFSSMQEAVKAQQHVCCSPKAAAQCSTAQCSQRTRRRMLDAMLSQGSRMRGRQIDTGVVKHTTTSRHTCPWHTKQLPQIRLSFGRVLPIGDAASVRSSSIFSAFLGARGVGEEFDFAKTLELDFTR